MYVITAYLLKSDTKYKILNYQSAKDLLSHKSIILFLSQLGFHANHDKTTYRCISPSFDAIKTCLESITFNSNETRQQRLSISQLYSDLGPIQRLLCNSGSKWKCAI